MSRPLTKLLAQDCKFVWDNQCDISFQMLKDALCKFVWDNQCDISFHTHCILMQASMDGQEY